MHTEERLRLSGAENTGRETGGLMLSINGLHNFYYLPELHDMRCKAQRICEIIRGRYHRVPLNGDVYIFMSKDQRKVRIIHYEHNAYYLHEKSFIKGYKFMKIERKDDLTVLLQPLQVRLHSQTRPNHAACRKLRPLLFPRRDHTGKE